MTAARAALLAGRQLGKIRQNVAAFQDGTLTYRQFDLRQRLAWDAIGRHSQVKTRVLASLRSGRYA